MQIYVRVIGSWIGGRYANNEHQTVVAASQRDFLLGDQHAIREALDSTVCRLLPVHRLRGAQRMPS
jgi:hypothetical protein